MDFANQLVTWYKVHKRDLPWRQTTDPYAVWLSEIILQQTRVDQGLPYFQRFIEKYPNVKKMAAAPLEEVMRLWQGLGYYSRARNLYATAQLVTNQHKGRFPDSYLGLRSLPGIGPYTAAAIASFCFGLPHAVVDGNVIRVLARLNGLEDPINLPATRKLLEALAESLLDRNDPATYNQAIMEFGAIHCKPVNPNCISCPFNEHCVAFRTDKVKNIPFKSLKITVRDRYFNYLVIHFNDSVLLKKRVESDIWQELHEPPLWEGSKLMTEKAMRGSSLWKQVVNETSIVKMKVLDPKPHKLTHQTIHSRFFVVTDLTKNPFNTSDWLVVKVKELNRYALPRMIELVFHELFDGYGQ
jgi:A/G-specific adenine glycosylase